MKWISTAIFLQIMIFGLSLFIILTQFPNMRQPSKLLVQVICIFSLLSVGILIWNYIRQEKE